MTAEPYRPPEEAFAEGEPGELRRYPLLAALLSAIVPGGGQIYTGRLALGLAVWTAFYGFGWIARSGVLARRPWLILTMLAVLLLVYLGSVIEATVVAFRHRRIPRRPTVRWSFLAPILALLFLVPALLPETHWAAAVTTGSMMPTILPGERVLIDPSRYREHRPERGDLAVFFNPGDGKRLLKRIVALGGEHVEMRGWRAVVEGDPDLDRWSFPSYQMDAPPFSAQVPEGHVFTLGDQRDNSRDSRHYGPVPENLLLGRAESIYWSSDLSRIGRRLVD